MIRELLAYISSHTTCSETTLQTSINLMSSLIASLCPFKLSSFHTSIRGPPLPSFHTCSEATLLISIMPMLFVGEWSAHILSPRRTASAPKPGSRRSCLRMYKKGRVHLK